MLKLARGDLFIERHWVEFLQMAQLPAMSAQQITFDHLLKSQANLTLNFNLLKVTQ